MPIFAFVYKFTNIAIIVRKTKVMAILDIVILCLFVPAIVQGISKGFVSQLISIVSILAGLWAGFKFSEVLAAWLGQYITMDAGVLRVICFIVVALIAIVVLNLLGDLLTKLLQSVSLGWLNRITGLIFAILKAALIIGLLILLFDSINAKFHFIKEEVFDNAVVYGAVKDFAQKILPDIKSLIAGIPNA